MAMGFNNNKSLPYPLALSGSSSDFFVVPSKSFEKFSHIVGILAGGEIFPEASIGTALILSTVAVKTEKDCNIISDWRLEKKNLDFSRENSIDYIEELFYEDKNFLLHPIKLSKLLAHKSSFDKLINIVYRS